MTDLDRPAFDPELMPVPAREKRVAILQSNYIPWKGYFDLIRSVDEFIVYDDVQFTKNDWRNRNRIKTRAGTQWLTIPVLASGHFGQTIRQTMVKEPRWAKAHLQTILQTYARAPFLPQYRSRLEESYAAAAALDHLSEINRLFLDLFCELLDIRTRITSSEQYVMEGDRTERLVGICRQAGASAYLSGPAAKEYIDESKFREAGLALEYADYSGYPEYNQPYPPFEHGVSIVDLVLCTGPDATKLMKRL